MIAWRGVAGCVNVLAFDTMIYDATSCDARLNDIMGSDARLYHALSYYARLYDSMVCGMAGCFNILLCDTLLYGAASFDARLYDIMLSHARLYDAMPSHASCKIPCLHVPTVHMYARLPHNYRLLSWVTRVASDVACVCFAGVDWSMVAQYVDISGALPAFEPDAESGSDDESSTSGTGPPRRSLSHTNSAHNWADRVGIAQVLFRLCVYRIRVYRVCVRMCA